MVQPNETRKTTLLPQAPPHTAFILWHFFHPHTNAGLQKHKPLRVCLKLLRVYDNPLLAQNTPLQYVVLGVFLQQQQQRRQNRTELENEKRREGDGVEFTHRINMRVFRCHQDFSSRKIFDERESMALCV